MLREGVHGVGREGDEARQRRCGHQRATAAPLDGGHTGPEAEDDAVDVGAHDASVLRVGELVDGRLAGGHAGVHVGDVEATQLALHPIDGSGPRARVAHVERQHEVACPLRRLLEVDHHRLGALLGEQFDGGRADARRPTGHQRHLAVEHSHVRPPLSWFERSRRRARHSASGRAGSRPPGPQR